MRIATLLARTAAEAALSRSDVLKAAVAHGGTVFGGYLRDLISALEPPRSDVDVWFTDSDAAGKFISFMTSVAGASVEEQGQGGHRGYGYGYHGRPYGFDHFRLDGPGLDTYVDVVITDNPHKDRADVDINMLTLDRSGLGVAQVPGRDLVLEDVVAHIRQGVFEVLPTCPPWRLKRMIGKGWRPVGESIRPLMAMALRVAGLG